MCALPLEMSNSNEMRIVKNVLKKLLIGTPIMREPNWKLHFEFMCDGNDQAMRVILRQRDEGKPYVIY